MSSLLVFPHYRWKTGRHISDFLKLKLHYEEGFYIFILQILDIFVMETT